MTCYVIARNGGYEGHSPPLLATSNRADGERALRFMRASGGSESFELFEVPEWPNAPMAWWETKPLVVLDEEEKA